MKWQQTGSNDSLIEEGKGGTRRWPIQALKVHLIVRWSGF